MIGEDGRLFSGKILWRVRNTTMKQLILQFENARVMNRLIKVSKLMKGVSIVDVTSTPKKSGLDTALEDVKEGKVYKAKNVFIEYTRQFKRSVKLYRKLDCRWRSFTNLSLY